LCICCAEAKPGRVLCGGTPRSNVWWCDVEPLLLLWNFSARRRSDSLTSAGHLPRDSSCCWPWPFCMFLTVDSLHGLWRIAKHGCLATYSASPSFDRIFKKFIGCCQTILLGGRGTCHKQLAHGCTW